MSESDKLWQNVLDLAARARRAEEAGLDCTKHDAAYMSALFAYHDAIEASSPSTQPTKMESK